MERLGPAFLLIVAVYFLAFGTGTILMRRDRFSVIAICIAAPAALVSPMLLPADQIITRALTAFVTTDVFFRLIDFHRHVWAAKERPALSEFCIFLVPFPLLFVVFADRCRAMGHPWFCPFDILRVMLGACGVAAGFLLLDLTASVAAFHNSFVLDHVAKVAIFLLTIESGSQVLYGLERSAGMNAPAFIQFAFLSRTPAEFWARYNTRVHRWLYENCFRVCGGRHAPIRGTILVFLLSAVLHELMFDIATLDIDGYQFLFFLIQAPAVLASKYLERLTKRGGFAGAMFAHAVTIVWMTATSIFFLHGIHKIFPILYVSEHWLP